jgi:hypothetical protein
MKTTLTALFALAIALFFHQDLSAKNSPFTAQALCFKPQPETVKFTSFSHSLNNNKVLLNWTIAQNQQAYQFEVERSEDGKNFVTAALVFGTDKADSDNYMFYEKARKEGTSYRIKVIQKDGTVDYSTVIITRP